MLCNFDQLAIQSLVLFFLSRLDYDNLILAGIPQHLLLAALVTDECNCLTNLVVVEV